MTAALTTTAFLAMLGYTPAMAGPQRVNVVWLDTSKAQWLDTSEPRAAIRAALAWWEQQTDVRFTVEESAMVVNADILSLNVCRDRGWLPRQADAPTLYLIATNGDALLCDGVAVGDYTTGVQAVVWGEMTGDSPSSQATIAHTIAHLYGATDKHDPPSGDLMDRAVFVEAYKAGVVCEATWREIGANPTRRAGRAVPAASAEGRRWQRGRVEKVSYLYERSFWGILGYE